MKRSLTKRLRVVDETADLEYGNYSPSQNLYMTKIRESHTHYHYYGNPSREDTGNNFWTMLIVGFIISSVLLGVCV